METKEVFAVIGNTDCTEGRGTHYVKAYCATAATAQRIGHKGYVQGGNCPVEKRTLYRPEGRKDWHGPVDIEQPNKVDRERQVIIDEQNTAVEKAKKLGLTDEEIQRIRRTS